MRKFRVFNEEVLIEHEERKDFIELIKEIFMEEVVDKWDIEQLPDDNEEGSELPGIFYDIHDIYLAIDSPKPHLEINLWSGNYYYDKFEQMESSIDNFVKRVNRMGYKCEYNYPFKEYIKYTEIEFDPEPFEIKIYYNL